MLKSKNIFRDFLCYFEYSVYVAILAAFKIERINIFLFKYCQIILTSSSYNRK
ncbi:hypothetical protein THOB06_40217 [Vibrio rotiferianus]|nr:hypothetical protein THOG10_40218 [Vibrio rotiferianus]CAH1589422.1 hypothetical protein THOB06_40217 [Vibrio rotiferianus]